jgi:hypothetical protein
VACGVSDPRNFYVDPDPAFHVDTDPNPTFHSDADPDPTFQTDADPDPTTQFFFHIWTADGKKAN